MGVGAQDKVFIGCYAIESGKSGMRNAEAVVYDASGTAAAVLLLVLMPWLVLMLLELMLHLQQLVLAAAATADASV